jgi:hypothetical protein
LVAEVRLVAAAARLAVVFLAAPFAEERAEDFVPLRADERAAVFFAEERAGVLPADFLAVVLAVVLFAPDLAADFFAVDLAEDFAALFLAPLFEADFVVFFAALFFAVDLAALRFELDEPAVFLAAVFLAAVFFAPLRDFDAALRFAPDELREPLRAALVVELLAFPALPVPISLGIDLSSVGMVASFKGLRVHRHACKRQRRYIKQVPTCENCTKSFAHNFCGYFARKSSLGLHRQSTDRSSPKTHNGSRALPAGAARPSRRLDER